MLNIPLSFYYFTFCKMLQTYTETIISGFELPPQIVPKKPVMLLEVSLRWPAISIQHDNQSIFPELMSCMFLLSGM